MKAAVKRVAPLLAVLKVFDSHLHRDTDDPDTCHCLTQSLPYIQGQCQGFVTHHFQFIID
jgi:hypothetical protein